MDVHNQSGEDGVHLLTSSRVVTLFTCCLPSTTGSILGPRICIRKTNLDGGSVIGRFRSVKLFWG